MRFDTFVMVDWSGGNDRGAMPKEDAIWACVARHGSADEPEYFRNRQKLEGWLTEVLDAELRAGRTVCAGFDFPFGYPKGFARELTGADDPLALWDWFAERVQDAPKINNRFDLAGEINLLCGGRGPFWGNGRPNHDIAGLPRTKRDYDNLFPDKRAVEQTKAAKGAFTCWQLSGAGAVGSQVIMGLPVLSRLRHRFAGQVAVWPFETLDRPIALIEIWPSLPGLIAAPVPDGIIKDAHQVREVARALAAMGPEALSAHLAVDAPEEGWIFGVPAPRLQPMNLIPPPLRDDCFAMPQGAHWTPVDTALALLRDRLTAVTGSETVAVGDAAGRILSGAVTAVRSHPPHANTAVDGYAFAQGSIGDGPQTLPLLTGRAAAGVPYPDTVPTGQAIRVLTGASLPAGTDTVVLQEDTTTDNVSIAFHGPLKRGANTRKAGEDMQAGADILPAGRQLTAADLGTLTAAGVATVGVRKRLRVAILSTGDELRDANEAATDANIYDANRPMLRAVVARWGYDVIDLGRVGDSQSGVRAALDRGAAQADAILTSGGASAGDEDHVSAALTATGSMALWRIALKPGRPLALGLWQGVPVFGLPGNPVAALICTLIFARPALGQLAGAGWCDPQGFDVPAAFTKSKKDGRREYLRARIRDGKAEVFRSEGSGRVSGLSWATGLVELPDHAVTVVPGTPVRYFPYESFGF